MIMFAAVTCMTVSCLSPSQEMKRIDYTMPMPKKQVVYLNQAVPDGAIRYDATEVKDIQEEVTKNSVEETKSNEQATK